MLLLSCVTSTAVLLWSPVHCAAFIHETLEQTRCWFHVVPAYGRGVDGFLAGDVPEVLPVRCEVLS